MRRNPRAERRRASRFLYVSVHQILEYDEISLFHDLGHFVFPLGVYFGGTPAEPFRPPIEFGPLFDAFVADFAAKGGCFRYGLPADQQSIPSTFVEQFDVVIVMHDFAFIDHHWPALSVVKVVWRSIGVGTEAFEPRVRALRDQGCRVVRYSPTEERATNYAGHDAVIRFAKPDKDFGPWTGGEPQILTFSHAFAQRFPLEHTFYGRALVGQRSLLGGAGNDGASNALGIVDFPTQKRLLATSAAYFYAAGTFIPYTLNFMEAWLTGIPLVAIDCRQIYPPHQCIFAEVPSLIVNGETGFLAGSPEQAAGFFRDLLADPALARRIGDRGAATARGHFSVSVVGSLWQDFFLRIGLTAADGPTCDHERN